MSVRVLTGDCREIMPPLGPFDLIIADPPYGDTSLAWDRPVHGWFDLAYDCLKPTGSLWLFGSMRSLLGSATPLGNARFRYVQDIVWEKHNGSGFAADRFKRVHEHAIQLRRVDSKWSEVFNDVQKTMNATKKTSRSKRGPAHFGDIGEARYQSEDGGPLIMRSVIPMRSRHGSAIHPTEKPSDLMEIIVRTSCPPNGIVADWFAGSGAAGEACSRAGRQYVGCEIDAEMAEKARSRLAGLLPFGEPITERAGK